MPTIFIKNLKDLIFGQLNIRWSALNAQQTAYDYGFLKLSSFVHDTMLSVEQADIIANLQKTIVAFNGTGNDQKDKEKLKEHIAEAKKAVETARVDHEAGATSDTLTCLQDVSNAIENFYMQLQDFPFPLLGLQDAATPEFIIYSHACHYLGLAKFQPDPHCSIEIRKQKEQALYNRLDKLKKAIRPEYTLDEQREVALQALKDLDRDNNDIVKPKKAVSVPLVSAGFSLFSMPVKAQTSSVGTLEKEILLATKEINAMTVDTSACPKPKAATIVPMLVRTTSKDAQLAAELAAQAKAVVKTARGGEVLADDEEVVPVLVTLASQEASGLAESQAKKAVKPPVTKDEIEVDDEHHQEDGYEEDGYEEDDSVDNGNSRSSSPSR
ncbi:hypothetical protein [Legionella sp. km772]|uniref:hypothetical protein n=1 Tax=Legionella sp. km772 TaxID=2498111 RepID=UPI000F8D8619|nr:hypothetical protein [Legionella sp. km772]RUR13119.1 hypothetical protein ELY15_03190 [Legionella sp. km772]